MRSWLEYLWDIDLVCQLQDRVFEIVFDGVELLGGEIGGGEQEERRRKKEDPAEKEEQPSRRYGLCAGD